MMVQEKMTGAGWKEARVQYAGMPKPPSFPPIQKQLVRKDGQAIFRQVNPPTMWLEEIQQQLEEACSNGRVVIIVVPPEEEAVDDQELAQALVDALRQSRSVTPYQKANPSGKLHLDHIRPRKGSGRNHR